MYAHIVNENQKKCLNSLKDGRLLNKQDAETYNYVHYVPSSLFKSSLV